MAESRRASVERAIELLFGVDVAVFGPVEIELWPSPGLQLAELSIAPAGQWRLEVARTVVKLAPGRLLSGGSVLQEVLLHTGSFDRSSATTAGDRTAEKPPKPTAPAALSSAFAAVLKIEHLSVSDFRFVLGNLDDGWAFNLTLDRATSRLASNGNVQDIEIEGDLNGRSFRSSATVDRVRRVAPEARPFAAHVAFAARSLTGAFDIHSPTAYFDQDLELDVQATAGSELARLLDVETRFTGELRFEGQVSGSDEAARIEGHAAIGGTRIEGRLTGSVRENRSYVTGRLLSSAVHGDQLLDLAATRLAPKVATQRHNRTATPKRWSLAQAIDFDVDLAASEFLYRTHVFSEVSGKLVLKRGLLKFDPFRLSYAQGHFRGSAAIDAAADEPNIRVEGHASEWQLASILGRAPFGFQVSGRLDLSYDVSAHGPTWAHLWKAMSGHLLIKVSDGRLDTDLLNFAGLGLLRAIFTASTWQGYSDLRCFLAPISLNAGLARTARVFVQTDAVRLIGQGTIDLRRDFLSLHAQAQPLNAPDGPVVTAFGISGPLSRPSVSLQAPTAGLIRDGDQACCSCGLRDRTTQQ
jgi:uncharacterized protein involved in outer membrane biogenesis